MSEYRYDGMGRKVRAVDSQYVSGQWTVTSDRWYLYDGWNCVAELLNQSSTLPSFQLSKSYTWGLDLSGNLSGAGGVGGLLSATTHCSPLTTHWFAYDGNGNVVNLLDMSSGSISAHYEYDPFGRLVCKEGSYADENEYRFSTKRYNASWSLYDYGYRHYSPDLGRWLSRDDVYRKTMRHYTFVDNSTVGYFDLLGLLKVTVLSPTSEVNDRSEEDIKASAKRVEQAIRQQQLQENIARLIGQELQNKLLALCPKDDKEKINVTPVQPAPQCCTKKPCERQAKNIATSVRMLVQSARRASLKQFSDPPTGSQADGNYYNRPEKYRNPDTPTYVRAEYGLTCGEWARSVSENVETATHNDFSSFGKSAVERAKAAKSGGSGTGCFRGRQFQLLYGVHAWFVVFNPRRTDVNTYDDSDVVIDLWRSGGGSLSQPNVHGSPSNINDVNLP
jgi:RHS repeat-associated protein